MNEFNQIPLVEAIKELCDENNIRKIYNYIKKNPLASIGLCYPLLPGQRNVIHFIIQGDKEVTVRKRVDITSLIQSTINYRQPFSLDEEYLIVIDRELYEEDKFTQRFSGFTSCNPENFEKIIEFFTQHYAHLSPDLKDFLNQHAHVGSDDLYEPVKNAPRVYNYLKRAPEKLLEMTEDLKRRLVEDKKASNTARADVPTRIPVK